MVFGGLGQTTEWGFDRLGRQVSIAGYTDEDTPGTRQVTGYAYDDLGRVVTITYPDTKTIEYVFNKQGKVKRRTDQRDIFTYYDKIYRKTFGHRGGGPYNEYTYDDLV